MRDKTVNEKFFILTLFGIAYELMYGDTSFLFAGDVERDEDQSIQV